MNTLTQFKEKNQIELFGQFSEIRKDMGVISDVSVMSVGEAKGHGMMIDETTLEQLTQLMLGLSVPAYVTHDGASYGDRVTKEIGVFYGFSYDKDSGKVRGSFKAFDSFKKHDEKTFDTLFELADKVPQNFGVSVVFNLGLEWELEDGNKIESFVRPDEATNEMPFVRPKQVFSIDFVDRPAGNDGLFREQENKNNTMDKKTEGEKPKEQESKEFSELQSQFDNQATELSELKAKLEEKEELTKGFTERIETLEKENAEFKEAHDSMTEQKAELSEKLEEAEKENGFWKANFSGVKPHKEEPEQPEKSVAELKEEAVQAEMSADSSLSKQMAILKAGRNNPELWSK